MSTTKIYYLTDSIGDVRYVGKTIKPLKIRLHKHLTDKDITHKTNWIKKSGIENIQIHLIEECDSTNWVEREMFWIKYYKDKGANLTNSTNGGDGLTGFTHTEKSKRKMSESAIGKEPWNKGKTLSEEHIENIKKAKEGFKHSEETKILMSEQRKGHLVTDETKQKISIANTGKKHTDEAKLKMSIPIIQLDKEGNYIKDWVSGSAASKELNISAGHISSVINGSRKSAGGYKWIRKT